MNIQQILEDYFQNDLTHGEIKNKYGLNHETEFAITEYSESLSLSEIGNRLKQLKPGMKDKEIKDIMKNA